MKSNELRPTPAHALAARRTRLRGSFESPLLLAAGTPRWLNFPGNALPFRAESHFLYLVGRGIPGAVLWADADEWRLYAEPADPAAALWHGPQPTLSRLEEELELEVRPLGALPDVSHAATIPPQDPIAARWLADKLGRPIDYGNAERLSGPDRGLALAMVELRLAHDAWAVEQLRQAVSVTDHAHRAAMRQTAVGVQVARVRAALEAEFTARRCRTAYTSIVTTRGEILHDTQSVGDLNPSDLLLVDAGAETPEGWASDVTRAWPASGRYDAPTRALYEVVLAAQAAARARCKPGIEFREVHRTACRSLLDGLVALGIFSGDPAELFELRAAELFFPHGVGHLLGLDVHDMEDLGDLAGYAAGRARTLEGSERFLRLDRPLRANMAITIEPGWYWLEGMLHGDHPALRCLNRNELERYRSVRGVRIEDDVLITDDGADLLSQSIPRSCLEIEAAVGASSVRSG